MKKLFALLVLLVSGTLQAQVYTMQDGTFSTCSGTFYDSGGAAGNYGSSENYEITFCPAAPGTYIQLNFSEFNIEGEPFDYMRIYNGTGTGGTLIGSFGNTSPMCSPVIASTHPSGCLTVTFVSDGSFQYSGWAAQIVCSNVPGGVPVSGPINTVCSGADPFCADAGPLQFPNSSDGGCVPDAPAVVTANTCLLTAPNPAWYYLEIGIPGNVNLEIEQTTGPNGTGTGLDVDYAIWGPFMNAAQTCANFTLGGCVADHDCFGNVVDCSYSDQPIENATIPNAQVGQIYMVLITNYDGNPGYISMTQTNAGNPGAGSTDCSIVCPTAAGINPTTCGATDGNIKISGLDPNTNYTVTYLDDSVPVSISVTSNAAGIGTLLGLNAGNYTNIGTSFPGCTSVTSNVVLTAAIAPVLNNVTNNTPICSGSNAVFNLFGTANATVTFHINAGGNQTVVLSAAGTATVTINAVAATTTMTITSISLPGCTATLAASSMVSVNATPTIALDSAAATTSQILCINATLNPIEYVIGNGATGATVTGLPAGVTATLAGNTYTISGAPTVSGNYNYSVETIGGCGIITLSGTIAINGNVTMALVSGGPNRSVCINTPLVPIQFTLGNGATGATIIGLPTGVTGSFASGVFTISGTPTNSGVANYVITTTGGCSSVMLNGVITIKANVRLVSNTPLSFTNQTVCVNSNIADIRYDALNNPTGMVITGLPPGVFWDYTWSWLTIHGIPTVAGVYNYTVTTVGGCGSDTASGTITVLPQATITQISPAGTESQAGCVNMPVTPIVYTIDNGTDATASGLPAGVTGSFAAGTFTISGTPTVSGPFNYTVTTIGGCASSALSGMIAINPAATIALDSATATTSQTLCINTGITDIAYLIGGSATGATVTGLPAGVAGSFASGTFTISGTPVVSGLFNYTVTTTGGCASAILSGTIAVNPNTAMTQFSAAGTENQTLCIDTPLTAIVYTISEGGSTTATGLPDGLNGNFAGSAFTISGTPTVSGIFNYTITAVGNCGTLALNGVIEVKPRASIALNSGNPNQTLCISAVLNNIAYAITDGGTGATVLGLPAGVTGAFSAGIFTIGGSPTVTGTFNYTVTATGSNCSSPSLSGTIVVNPNVAIALTSAATTANQTLCINNTITPIVYAIANGGTGAIVSGLPTGVSGSFNLGLFQISGTPTVPGIFNYSVTTTGGCPSAVLNGTIAVNPNATITLTSNAATAHQGLCINTPIIPIFYSIANGGTGVTVTGLPVGITAVFASGILTISGTPTVSGELNYAIVTSGGCLTATALGSFSINPNAVITLNSAIAMTGQVVCVNSAIQPIGYTISSGGSGAMVNGLPTGLNGNYVSGIFTISGTPTQSGVFHYSVATTGGCSTDSETGAITVNALATATMHYAGSPYCTTLTSGQPVSLSGTGPFSGGAFSSATGLSVNSTTGAINPALSTPGNYTVTYLIPPSGGCPAIPIYATVTVTKVPTAAISYATPFCTAVNTLQSVSLSGTAAYQGGTFSAPSGLNINTITGAINPALSVPGNYTVTYQTQAAGGCGAVPATASVTINATPIAVATPASQAICSEGTTNIGLSSIVAGTAFIWTVVQNNVSGASNGSGNLIAQTLETTTNTIGNAVYTIIPSTAFCTGNPITVTVTVNPLPRPSLVGGVICRNPNTGIVMRTYTLNAGLNNADYDFAWSHNTATILGATDNAYIADEPGVYTVVATNVHTGCVSYPVDATVSESEIAEIAVISGNDAFVDDPVITVTVIGSGNYEYQLDNGNFQTSNAFMNVNIGAHTIHVRDQDDCTDIAQKFTLIGYPKFFTPNNDGYNDTWNISALSDQKNSKISIFDRYGKLIKKIGPTEPGWDGTYDGHLLPSTDYWFVVDYFDQTISKEFKAHFSLKR